MAGAEQGVVEQDGVAGLERLDGMGGERVPHGEGHRTHVPGAIRSLGDHSPVGVEDRDREVLPLARLLGIGRAMHGRADLHGDGLERAPDDAEGDRVEPAHSVTSKLAYPSTTASTPGGSTVVDSRSSTMAGPVSASPAGSA